MIRADHYHRRKPHEVRYDPRMKTRSRVALALLAPLAAAVYWATFTRKPRETPPVAPRVETPSANVPTNAPVTLPTPDDLIDHVTCPSRPPLISLLVGLETEAYASYTKVLREAALERGVRPARGRARSALIEAVATRAGVPLSPALDPATARDPTCPPRLAPALVDLYAATTPADAPRLHAALASPDLATRLVAANAISHAGATPSAGDVATVLAAMRRETQGDAKFELIMAFASHVQRNKTALPELRALLLSEETPSVLARRIARELPGEDLRYRLFRDLASVEGRRAVAIRGWIREGRAASKSRMVVPD